ncbi:hypothetical protein [Komagataeibacter sp. FXV3]|uniref:hypothetical protein n=1 Tax=Komagataeibacter sp. FXV3 TaxID=2608998 RepID=UPI00187B864D|nr:hypothetical protein [Komagataeibacter sp. FXV3]MBE7731092.1 hypothetical protein [Komagataeibacter sp. FXV3]
MATGLPHPPQGRQPEQPFILICVIYGTRSGLVTPAKISGDCLKNLPLAHPANHAECHLFKKGGPIKNFIVFYHMVIFIPSIKSAVTGDQSDSLGIFDDAFSNKDMNNRRT